MERFNNIRTEITLDEIKEIANPLFKKYGFDSAYVYGYYAANTKIVDTEINFMVESFKHIIDIAQWNNIVKDFEVHFNMPCQVLDMRILDSDEYPVKHTFDRQSILIYENEVVKTKKNITLDEIKEITTPLFKKYGFKSAYLFGYYAENTEIIDIDMEFAVEDSAVTEEFTVGELYDLIEEFEAHLHIRCQVIDMDYLESHDNYMTYKFNNSAILIYKDENLKLDEI